MSARKPGETLLIPETVLKKRHDMDEMKARRVANLLVNPHISRKIVLENNTVRIRKPEYFIKRSRTRRNLALRYRRVQAKGMNTRASDKTVKKVVEIPLEDAKSNPTKTIKKTLAANSVDSSVVFVVRTVGSFEPIPNVCKRLLKELRLDEQYDGVFLRYNEEMRRKLHLVESLIVYGVLSKVAISDLIRRRGFACVNGDRTPLKDNVVVEQALGDTTGIICVEDLVFEIANCGDNFEAAATFLWPFRLQAPKSKYVEKTLNKHYTRADYGDKGEEMEEILRTML